MELITTGKELKPFWNSYCEVIGSRLWLPTETASLGSEQNCSNSYLRVTEENSWFSVMKRNLQNKNLQKIYSQFSTYSHAECMEVVSTKKIRIKPNKKQQQFLKEWIGSARNAYNYVVAKSYDHKNLNEDTLLSLQASGLTYDQSKEVIKTSTFPSWMELKRKDNLDYWNTREEWLKPIPSKCFTEAFKHACEARKAGFKKGSKFSLKFRSRKDKVQSCFIPKGAVKSDGIFKLNMKRFSGLGEIRFTEKLPKDHLDSELVLDHGQWFLCVPYKKRLIPVESQDKVVALDVGIRKFLTFYSEDSCGFIGKNATDRLFRLSKILDTLVSKIATSSGKLKRVLKLKADRLRVKIKNLVKELHYKVCNFLIKNFDLVLLPHYEIKDFVISCSRKLNNKSVRKMLSLSFYKFSQILIRKFNEKKGLLSIDGKFYSRVVRVNEAYTSKTQTVDGKIANVGSRETLKISKNVTIDRDINGARNIFLRALVDSPILRGLTS
ncbi:transposase [Vibrio phage 184E37.1]|nr:transposase [Vibrio phage 184E37.1]